MQDVIIKVKLAERYHLSPIDVESMSYREIDALLWIADVLDKRQELHSK